MPLLLSTSRGVSNSTFDAPVHVSPSADTIAASGDPIAATTTGPNVPVVRCPNRCAGLGAVNVTTASARNASAHFSSRASASQPDGKSTATTGLTVTRSASRTAAATPRNGGLNPVPVTASNTTSTPCSSASTAASVPSRQLSDLHRRAVQQTERVRRRTLQPALRPGQRHGHLQPVAQQRTRRHQTVATIVARAAQHQHPPRPRILRAHKPCNGRAGILHQLAKGRAKLLGRTLVGRGHLGRCQHLHTALDAAQGRSGTGLSASRSR